MKINTALILCAGYGKRLNPLTLEVPKPLLKINEITLLENCINLVKFLGIEKIIIKVLDLTMLSNEQVFFMKDKFLYHGKQNNIFFDTAQPIYG